jgi:transcriptional regulator with GAF, ATPase, and Fis domain
MMPEPRTQVASATWPLTDTTAIVSRLLQQWLDILVSRPSRPGQWQRASERWIAALANEISKTFAAAEVALLSQVGSQWIVIARGNASLDSQALRDGALDEIVSRALDSPGAIFQGNLAAVSIHRGGEVVAKELLGADIGQERVDGEANDFSRLNLLPPTVMALHFVSGIPNGANVKLNETLSLIATALQSIDRQQYQLGIASDTAFHLRRLLQLSIQWSQVENTDQLLEAIAASSAEMLNAERASIFLWDKKAGKLIGRPALGVEGGKLEVDDKAGIVGAVLATGTARIWNSHEDNESEINRSVDKRLKFQTKSLAAVPLRSPNGTLIGVFEVLNKRQGRFDAYDVTRLFDLARHAAAAIQGTETRQRLTTIRDRLLFDAASSCQVIGDSTAIRSLRDTVTRVAKTDLAVLILGENGTGKEVLARSIHFQSGRRDQPFVAVNCAALVETLLESELFGHERGAFTDAVQARPGKFELASGGTLFLDEIGDMSPGGQAKLLRVLEEKIVVRVGGSTPIPVDVRVIAATNQSLTELVATKRFREDLFFRLNVVAFRLPALRERGDDVLKLAEHFLAQFSSQIGRIQPTFSDEAKNALRCHPWPGNVRELRNAMERACYLALGDQLTEADLGLVAWEASDGIKPRVAQRRAQSSEVVPLNDATRDFQVAHIQAAIDVHRGNMTMAAESLGLHRSNLYRKMRQLGMKTDESELSDDERD